MQARRISLKHPKTFDISRAFLPLIVAKLSMLKQVRFLLDHHHRLNGSSSPVLTATSLSYGKAKNSTPHRIKTPDLIEIKFGITAHAKFHVNPSKGSFPANGWNIRKKFYRYPYTIFFRNSPTGQTFRRIFARDGSNDTVSRKDVPFEG